MYCTKFTTILKSVSTYTGQYGNLKVKRLICGIHVGLCNLYCDLLSCRQTRHVSSGSVDRTVAIAWRKSNVMGSVVSCRKWPLQGVSDNIESRNMSAKSNETFETVLCNVNDIPDEGMKSFDVDDEKILLVKTLGEVTALGAKCTHYGLALEKGTVCNGRIRCPFHGACFNAKTGDIEDFPGLDSLPVYDLNISDEGDVQVKINRDQLRSHKRMKELSKRDSNNNSVFIVVGGGAAGSKCVETLRQEGFTGRLVFISSENCLPYDRPKLSKSMHLTAADMALRNFNFFEEADIELELGSSLVSLNAEEKQITLSNNKELFYDKIFLATGGIPRALSVPGSDLEGVFVLRSPTDGNAIVESAKGKRVVIVGSSFIGMEAAAYLSQQERCASLTVVGSSAVPFERSLGRAVGERLQSLFEEKGVSFISEAAVTRLEGDGRVEKVIVNDDQELDADIILCGIGVIPSTSYLADSGVIMDERGFVPVNEEMQTNVDGVYVGGDIASFPLFLVDNKNVSIGHWQMSLQHGHIAALNMMGKESPIKSVPYFWTMLFGRSIRYAGYGSFDDVIIDGDLENLGFIAYYCQGDKVVAVASLGRDPAAAKYADYLLHGKFLTKQEVLDNGPIVMDLQC